SYTYWSNFPVEGFMSFGTTEGFSIGAFPTHHGHTLVNVIGGVERFSEWKSNVEENYLKVVSSVPFLASRLVKATREERFFTTADLRNYFRRPFGPGWALVGDAGYVRDPITAQGISDSFLSAELLTQAIDEVTSGRTHPMSAFAEYERRRNAQVFRMYDFTLTTASLALVPEDVRFLQSIARSPKDSNEFFGAFVGTVPIEKFHHPLNITRIITANT
ncbi:MAG TPA: FAD-binding monooxygenase, partial [Myxococcota bacterium]|nr:FAD-binding monooxygenase [Myxococcota bacterium]